jgi:hypothetical protein
MIQLWKYSMLHICHVIENINSDKLSNEWIAGPEKKNSLESMTVDYPEHLKLRLTKIKKLINSKP